MSNMKTTHTHTRLACLVLGFAIPSLASAAEPYQFERGYPTAATSKQARDDADFQRAITAYRFWYPTVSAEGLFNGLRAAGVQDNKSWTILAAGPSTVGFTANSDTPYGTGVLDLSKGPWVIEMPKGAYIGLVNDHHQGWVMDMGITGPDAGKGGKYLVLPPDWKGQAPKGYYVGKSKSLATMVAARAVPFGGDVKGAMDALRRVKIHPLASAASPQALEAIDTTGKPMDVSPLKWEDNMQFWQVLHRVLSAEPLVPNFLPMYGPLAELGIEKGKPFQPDARMTGILERAAKVGRDQLLVSAFDSARPDRINWPDRKWEWVALVPGSAQFETTGGIDLEARDRWFAQAIVTSPTMFSRAANARSLYWLSVRDSTGAWLDGGKNYTLSVPQPVPARLFWSVTIYDAATRSEVQTDQNKAALRSLFELKGAPTNQPAVLYVGPSAPAGNQEHWVKTTPGKGWFAYIRIYGPEAAAFDRSWKPGDFEEVK
jgi:hypothetical protein